MGLLPLESGPQDHLFRGKLQQLFCHIMDHPGSSQMDYSRLMKTNRSNVARWVIQLERMGLVVRTMIPGPARTHGIFLTAKGKQVALSKRFLSGQEFHCDDGEKEA
jgi:DNA-binding MarR family transcriptional regulator